MKIITIFLIVLLSSCSIYKEIKYIQQEPAVYEYRCTGIFFTKCKKVNINGKIERVLKDKYQGLSEKELEKIEDKNDNIFGILVVMPIVSSVFFGIPVIVGIKYGVLSGILTFAGIGGIGGLILVPMTLCALTEEDNQFRDRMCYSKATEWDIEQLEKTNKETKPSKQ